MRSPSAWKVIVEGFGISSFASRGTRCHHCLCQPRNNHTEAFSPFLMNLSFIGRVPEPLCTHQALCNSNGLQIPCLKGFSQPEEAPNDLEVPPLKAQPAGFKTFCRCIKGVEPTQTELQQWWQVQRSRCLGVVLFPAKGNREFVE